MGTRIASATRSAAFNVEACVIGAGVVGLAVARALAIAGKEVIVLERESSIGSGTSSRNSEVIHSGIYYPQNSLKARLCVRGKKLIYEYCKDRAIPHEALGKLIVATNPRQVREDLPQIIKKAVGNGVHDLISLTGEDVNKYHEPQVSCEAAIFSPSTGIMDSHSYMVQLQADAEEHGMILSLNSPVNGAEIHKDGRITITSEGTDLLCNIVVNCAGLHADSILRMLLDSRDRDRDMIHQATNQKQALAPIHQYFAKGNYYRLEGQKCPFNHLVYPVPEGGGLGVHATIDLGRNTRFGPDVEWISPFDHRDPDTIDMDVDASRSDSFYDEVRKYWPGLKDGCLKPDYAGIRPKLGHPSNADGHYSVNADFIIHGRKDHGIHGLVSLMGIESPGLTASMAIGEEVLGRLVDDGAMYK